MGYYFANDVKTKINLIEKVIRSKTQTSESNNETRPLKMSELAYNASGAPNR